MNTARRLKIKTRLARLLILAVVLRTFIAPGYMLHISADGIPGIIFCDGPVSIDNSGSDHHSEHHHHGDKSNEAGGISPICSFWSTSGIGFLSPDIQPAPFIPAKHTPQVAPDPLRIPHSGDASRQIRGPPLTA